MPSQETQQERRERIKAEADQARADYEASKAALEEVKLQLQNEKTARQLNWK